MNGGSSHDDELIALRHALWDVAERAQRAIARLDIYVKARAPEAAPVPSGALMPVVLRQGHSREVARALRHIELHFDKPIDLVRLARVAGCSRSTLTRAFRRELGQTAHSYLMAIRLTRAACAMTSGDKIEAVMLGAGFRSKRNFYRLFKARFGKTPAQFSHGAPDQGMLGAPGNRSMPTGSA